MRARTASRLMTLAVAQADFVDAGDIDNGEPLDEPGVWTGEAAMTELED